MSLNQFLIVLLSLASLIIQVVRHDLSSPFVLDHLPFVFGVILMMQQKAYELCVFAFEKMWPIESNVWSLVNVADVCHFTKHVAFSDTDRRS